MTQQEFTTRYSYDPKSDQLGSGGFGSVYKAYDNENDCFVALKIATVDPQHPELRLRNEVAKAEHLKHKNVARYDACYTFETLSGEIDIAVMRYYEHGSLDGFMRKGSLTLKERYDILTQILEGIAYLHSHGIIHRDLKPQNVLMVHHAGRYIPKITDFGISKQLEDGESSLVSNSVLGGTRSYASPEQLCERALRKNTDLWSFGVIAYNMLLGELPFTTGTFSSSSDEGRSEQLRQVLSGKLPEGINHISEPWQSVIRGCLVVDGEKRLQQAKDCLEIISQEVTPGVEVAVEAAVEKTTIGVPDVDDKTAMDDIQPEQPKMSQPKVLQPSKPNDVVKKSKSRWWLWLLGLLLIVGGAFSIWNANKTDKETIYSVGDYYNENGKEGVVFEVSDGGRHGKIVSLNETQVDWYTGKEWCQNKGNGWYLPSKHELQTIFGCKSEINNTLRKNNAEGIGKGGYWSSMDYDEHYAWYVSMYDGYTSNHIKNLNYYVRAVSAF